MDEESRSTHQSHEATQESVSPVDDLFVANASIIPHFFETPDRGTALAPVVTKGICYTVSTTMQPLLDPRAHSSVGHVPGIPLKNLHGGALGDA